jgi:AraC family transcriptional regulator of adaptative response / DNA-3-methyladenine glycosylase II
VLNPNRYYRALTTRDARFDGRVFVAVTTTRIYCRPICCAGPAKIEHCLFFPSAAAAQTAGYRPCLRCRPERVADLGSWADSSLDPSNCVSRGLALIAEGVFGSDDSSVDVLALRLGVSAQHLQHVFQQQLAASPSAVARVHRVLFAKHLIHETRLPMTQVACAAGFADVRRFNESFYRLFERPPTALRRKGRRSLKHDSIATTGVTVHLYYRPPYDWPAMITFLAARALDGIEKVKDERYLRTLMYAGEIGSVDVTHQADACCLAVQIKMPSARSLMPIINRLRQMFDLAADVTMIGETLTRDPLLQPLIVNRPGLRLPTAWDSFELAMRAILGQQVTLQAGRRLTQTLVRLCGHQIPPASRNEPTLGWLFPTAAQVAAADLTLLAMPKARKRALQALANAALQDPLLFEASASIEQTVVRLSAIKGIGEWTAHYIAMRAARASDAFPASDVALLRYMERHQGSRPSKIAFNERAQQWRPWRAYAAQHLWTAGALCEADAQRAL